ncbi:MAG: AAA family ATPase, partial [Gemmatimonadetes bacterium]|nr:AAA family ATPase [Gemmatimonadota bacterium]
MRPASVEAEIAVLGGVYIDTDAALQMFASLTRDHFTRESHRLLFDAMHLLVKSGTAVDQVTLAEVLKDRGDYETVGGISFLASLMDAVPTAANAGYHVGIVRDRAHQRKVAALAEQLAQSPGDPALLAALREVPDARIGAERFRLMTDTDIQSLPPMEWLWEGVLPENSLAALIGPPEQGKSLLSLGLCFSAQTGTPYLDRKVRGGNAVCVAAGEGVSGLGSRTRAWKAANHYAGNIGAHFLTEPVMLADPTEVRHFVAAIRTLSEPPALIVIDTLARCYAGDENSTQDMSAFVAGADRLRTETGAAVLIVHHTNATGERERGNTALRGACDVMMLARKEGELITVSCEKMKDAPHFPKMHLRLVRVADSVVVFTAERAPAVNPDELTEKQAEILALLRTHFLENGATASEWLKSSGVPERTFYDARTALVRKGYVNAPEQPKGGRYTLTERGEVFVTAGCGDTADILR